MRTTYLILIVILLGLFAKFFHNAAILHDELSWWILGAILVVIFIIVQFLLPKHDRK